MKKILTVLLAASLLLSCLTACGSRETPTATDPAGFTPQMDREASAEIRVAGSWSNFQALEAAANDWNEIYPNVTVTYYKVDGYQDQLVNLLSEADRPEIVMVDADGYYTDKDKIVNGLVDLSNIGLSMSILSETVLAGSMVNGKFCTLNWGVVASGFAVNETLLQDLGLEIPKTHEAFLEVCEKLTQAGYVPIQGCTDSIYSILMNNGLNNILQQSDAAEKLLTGQPGCGAVLETEFAQMLDMVNKGYLDPEINNSIADIYESNILHFFEGSTPFLAFTTEGFSGMAKREEKSEAFTEHPFAYCFASLPVSAETPVLGISYLPGFSLVSGSREETWAREFMRFLCQERELNRMAETKGVPGVISGSRNENFGFLDEIPPENITPTDTSREAQLVGEIFSKTLWAIAQGEITDVTQAEQKFESWLREIL